MVQKRRILKIERDTSRIEGQILDYLFKHPSRKAASELAMEAITNYWCVEALGDEVPKEYLYGLYYLAAQLLRARLYLIEQKIGVTSAIELVAQKEPTKFSTKDDEWEDEGPFKIESDEIDYINKLMAGN